MNDKQLIAKHAADQVADGMLVGLGTGSTANYFIEELAHRSREQCLKVSTVSSSIVSASKAQQLGLPIMGFEQVSHVDLYVDGADEVSPELTLLKGQGADLVREKLLATACDRFLVLIESNKLVQRIGQRFPIPIEVMPFAWQLVKKLLEANGGHGDLRQNASKNGFIISSAGNLILDMNFGAHIDAKTLNETLNGIPGIVEHGIFYGLATTVLIGVNGEVEERQASL
ncbi:ribose-5-phosphate isomerase RpiA [Candidatus Methylobacter oryzae]|uniref:Ribose-5-phosphate isomerase A n=1 Tax=Candidatus Methylobacter oryzae TaxID=2497749 RepID=A0ABY3C765_9GAMM|nr:ribose-5-phosphate isomerase RpiA [Candidatus Methylobacter oryzae]TRW91478.1 ribose-5-phosphate isomerase RpiA [Candidatus Methylobacter oryzae]